MQKNNSQCVKISFVVSAAEGSLFTKYCLQSLYPYANEILIAKSTAVSLGGISNKLEELTTSEDPDNKIKIISGDVGDCVKEAQSEWLWFVDANELFRSADMDYICAYLTEVPETTCIAFEQKFFWGSPDYICNSTNQTADTKYRNSIFKWKADFKFVSADPFDIKDAAGVSLSEITPASGENISSVGIFSYNYSQLFPMQEQDTGSNPFQLCSNKENPSWIEKFNGEHPEQSRNLWKDVLNNEFPVPARNMDDVESFVDSYEYRKGIMAIRSEMRTRENTEIKMDDSVLRATLTPSKPETPPINILQLSTNESKGGAAQIHTGICNGLAKDERFTITSFVRDRDIKAPWCKKIYSEAIEKQATKKATPLMDYDIASSFYLLDKPEYKKSDLVHFHNMHGYYFNPLTMPLISLQKPTVWTLHDMNPITGHCGFSLGCEGWKSGCSPCPRIDFYPPLKKDVAGELLKDKEIMASIMETTVLASYSHWLKDLVKDTYLGQLECRILPNGIDTDIFKPYRQDEARKIFGIPQDAFVLAMTAKGGMQNEFKGGPYLEQAGIALQQINPKLVLLNIGGEYYSNKTNIINLPYIEDKNILALAYSAGDVFAFPSIGDNHPLAVLEAMCCGLPVVSFRTGGIPEEVIEGETGLIAEYKNVEQFITNLKIIMERPKLRQAMSIKAAERGSTFTLARLASEYIKLYEDILERERQTPKSLIEKKRRALEYLQSQLAKVGNVAGVEAYKKFLA